MAAVLAAGPGAALSHRSAATLWGLRRPVATAVELTAGSHRRRPGIRAHRASLAPDEVTISNAIPVTTVPRTLLDLAAVVPRRELERAINEAEVLRLTDSLCLDDLIRRYPRRHGVAALRMVLAAGRAGFGVTRSELEDRFLEFLDRAGLPRPEVNAIVEARGRRFEVDCVWRRQRLIVELDGRMAHGTGTAFERDRSRDRRLMVAGWRALRITWRQLLDEPDVIEADLRRLLGPHPRYADRPVISTNQFKNGSHIEVGGTIFRILDFQHVKPGKGGAFVRTKLRKLDDGSVQDKTFRAGEKFRPVRTESHKMQYLYDSGDAAVFMDSRDYEQLEVPHGLVEDAMRWIRPNDEVDVLFVDGRPTDVQAASAVDLQVTQTEPGVKGDTAAGGDTKAATLESGVTVQVPLFIEEGEVVRVDTRTGEYVSRA